ncbi:hypothetical protein M9H77_30735 [Catharanthus roseus]|uniref:Uncharacterized protein n=1 Tax=Catharanthus roseus TaxID=4058 RepID=A0ACB9ZY21_CATRO|nr:hypothetical protein M9H77_30735 [Catharanthus roseus]
MVNENAVVKMEEECYLDNKDVGKLSFPSPNSSKEKYQQKMPGAEGCPIPELAAPGSVSSRSATLKTMHWSYFDHKSLDSYLSRSGQKEWGLTGKSQNLESCDSVFVSQSSSSVGVIDERDAKEKNSYVLDGDDGVLEQSHPTSSSMTDSSNGSGSMMNGSSSCSRSFAKQKHSKDEASFEECGSKITVKASYKDDTVRFKFDPSFGCFNLYEEVARRFKLQQGTFQLKYMDDEEEWVMLVSDSDLQECLEILDILGTRSVKFLVRDALCAVGSSGSSNCFLGGGS